MLRKLKKAIHAEFEFYGSVDSFKRGFKPNGKPTCILINDVVGSVYGISLLQSMKEDGLTQPVVMMSSDYSVPAVVKAIKCGAHDFIDLPFDLERLKLVIKSALDSCCEKSSISKSESKLGKNEHSLFDGKRVDEVIESLPRRKSQTLERLLSGDSEKQVAYKLGISPHTVHDYVKWLYKQFDVSSRGELFAMFLGD